MERLLVVLLFLWSSGLRRTEGQHNYTGPQCGTTDKADVVLLVVCSGSSTSTFLDMKNFLKRIINAFDVGPDRVQMGLVCYNMNPKTEWHLNTHKTKHSLLEAVANLQGRGDGGLILTGNALDDILHNNFKPDVGMRADSEKIAVLITDRESQDDVLSPSQDLKAAGIEIYAIGVNDATDSELRSIASDPDEIHMYNVMDSLLLQDIMDNLTINLCNSTHSSDSVRLVNGTSPCSGRLEVKSNQRWSSVCEDDFDLQDAEVVCRELGCGRPSVLQGALYGEVEAPMWIKEFHCEGNESALLDCRSSGSARNTCSPGKAVGLTCSEPVRLVGGASRCAGTLEVKHQGAWRPVYDFNWTLTSADAVCRKLACGSAVSTRMRGKYSLKSAKSVWEMSSDCIKSGHVLRQCVTPGSSSSIIEITCSDSVRLVNGTSLCSGRLEVKSNQQWSSVCEDDFDQQDAEVVCRELGCGPPSVLQGALYGEVEALMWTEEFQCGGHESALLDCRRSRSVRNTCSPGKAVGLTCSEPSRLVEGSSRCAGTLEVKQGEWRPVYSFYWTLRSADAVCRKLFCGSAVSTGMRMESPYISAKSAWEISSDFVQSGHALRDCVKSGSSSSMIEITCSDSVRLVDGPSLCSGRLEVKSNQSNLGWSSVCEDDFDLQDAEVVCSELGCGIPSVLQGALYGEVEALMWTEEFQCEGNESALLDCRRSGSIRNTCSPGKAVGLTCSEPVRLVGGASRCAGTLEVKQGDWRPVSTFYWTLKLADLVCRKLFCGSAVSTGMREESSHRSAWKISSDCVHSGHALKECVKPGSSSSIIEIRCSDSVRLVDGTSLCSGRLEVKSNQRWSSVCEDDFDLQDAEVVCRELGCGAPSVLQGALYGEVEAPMWTKEFQCGGNESALLDCRSSGSARNTCSPGTAVGLTCSEPVRLVGGASHCAGTLEVKHQGDWRPVNGYWTLTSVAETCRNLDCGSAVSIEWRQEPSDRLVWEMSSYCTTSGFSLRECVTSGSSSSIMEIICADPPAFIIRPVVLPLTLLLFITVTCVIRKTSRGQKPGPQEDIELDCYDLGVGGAEGGPAEEEGAPAAE